MAKPAVRSCAMPMLHIDRDVSHITVFVFDEATIELHPLDVQMLLGVLNRLTENGATVIVIEHDLDLIRNADYVIDMRRMAAKLAAKSLQWVRRKKLRQTRTVSEIPRRGADSCGCLLAPL